MVAESSVKKILVIAFLACNFDSFAVFEVFQIFDLFFFCPDLVERFSCNFSLHGTRRPTEEGTRQTFPLSSHNPDAGTVFTCKGGVLERG